MNSKLRRKLDMFARVREFGKTHASVFPAGSRGEQLFASLNEVVTKLQGLAGTQASSRAAGRNVTTSKSVARAAVMDDLDAISFCARSLAVTIPGLNDKFRVPRKPTDQSLLAVARAFANDAAALKDEFIAMDMPANFLEELQADIDDLESVLANQRNNRSSHANATVSMDAVLGRGIDIVQQLKGIAHNRLADDEGLMAAWLRASRTEKARGRPAPASETPPATAGSGPDPGQSGAKSDGQGGSGSQENPKA